MRRLMLSALFVSFSAGMALAVEPAAPAAPEAKPAPMVKQAVKQVPAAKPAQAKKAKAPKVITCKGTVESMDVATGKLSVKEAKGAVKNFTIGAAVAITKLGKKITPAEVVAGDYVHVKLSGSADNLEVKSIQVIVKKPVVAKKAAVAKKAPEVKKAVEVKKAETEKK